MTRPPGDHHAAIGIYHAMDLAQAPTAPAVEPGDAAAAAAAATEPPAYGPAPDPAPPTEAAAPDGGDDGSIDAIRRRLAERGLLVQGPAIVVPKEPRPDRDDGRPVEKAFVFDDVLAEAEGELHPNAVPEDDWDLASVSDDWVDVRCPQCRGTQHTPVDVTRFRCHTCQRAWRWAICKGCDSVTFTVERQESWRCRCGHTNRAWWRTDVAARDAAVVVARRKDLAAQAERERVRAGMRTRRWKILTGAVVGLIAVLIFVAVVRAGERQPAAGTAETCRLFRVLKSDLGSGTLDLSQLDARLSRMTEASAIADDAVRTATADLVAAGGPNKVAFLVAETKLADACDAAAARN